MKPRKCKVWVLWYEGDAKPVRGELHYTRADARFRGGGILDLRAVQVEVREVKVKAKKARRKK